MTDKEKLVFLKDYWRELIYNRWVETTSSNLDEVYYEVNEVPEEGVPETGTLTVRFKDKNGSFTSEYLYSYVPPQVYEAMLKAPSKGSYFYWNIRTDYPYYKKSK